MSEYTDSGGKLSEFLAEAQNEILPSFRRLTASNFSPIHELSTDLKRIFQTGITNVLTFYFLSRVLC